MPTSTCGTIIDNLVYNCTDKSTGGLQQEIKLVNLSTIKDNLADFTVSDSSTQHTITAFAGTAANLNAVAIEGIPNKQLLKAGFATTETDFGTFVTHNVDLWSQAVTEKSMLFLKSLVNGAEVVAFIRQKSGGPTGEETYWVYGFSNGLKLGDAAFNSAENSGSFIIPIISKEPDLEPTLPYRLLLTDVATTKTFFDALTV
jgi:hypothetical protein